MTSAFSVPGASGFTNTLNTASLSVSFADGTSYNADIDLGIGGMYVSVDQTNAGAGFGSLAGPTYPLATYGSSAFSTYDLTTDFFASGFGPFLPGSASVRKRIAAVRHRRHRVRDHTRPGAGV